MTTLKMIVAAALLAAMGCNNAAMASPDDKPGAPAQKEAPGQTAWKVGDKVDASWEGKWWKAVILEVQSPQAYRVHYVGYSAGWDEVVTASRLRARTADSQRGPAERD